MTKHYSFRKNTTKATNSIVIPEKIFTFKFRSFVPLKVTILPLHGGT